MSRAIDRGEIAPKADIDMACQVIASMTQLDAQDDRYESKRREDQLHRKYSSIVRLEDVEELFGRERHAAE